MCGGGCPWGERRRVNIIFADTRPLSLKAAEERLMETLECVKVAAQAGDHEAKSAHIALASQRWRTMAAIGAGEKQLN